MTADRDPITARIDRITAGRHVAGDWRLDEISKIAELRGGPEHDEVSAFLSDDLEPEKVDFSAVVNDTLAARFMTLAAVPAEHKDAVLSTPDDSTCPGVAFTAQHTGIVRSQRLGVAAWGGRVIVLTGLDPLALDAEDAVRLAHALLDVAALTKAPRS